MGSRWRRHRRVNTAPIVLETGNTSRTERSDCGMPAHSSALDDCVPRRRGTPIRCAAPLASTPAGSRPQRSPRRARNKPTQPATPVPRSSRARMRASLAGRPLPGAVPARLDGRRFGGLGTPPGSRYTAGAGRRLTGRRLAVRLPRSSDGGGCAASLINQWKRLRRSEYQWGPGGRSQQGHPLGQRDRLCPAWLRFAVRAVHAEPLVAWSLTPMPAAVAGRLGAGCPGRRRGPANSRAQRSQFQRVRTPLGYAYAARTPAYGSPCGYGSC